MVFSEQLLDGRAAQGDDVALTLDRTIQQIAERELELTVRTFEAKRGSVVVMDPLHGRDPGAGQLPHVQSERSGRQTRAHRRNRAITDRFEPGSMIKPFTVAGALAAGRDRAESAHRLRGRRPAGGEYTIHDTHHWDELTPAEILAYSSNIGTAKIGMQRWAARGCTARCATSASARDRARPAGRDRGHPAPLQALVRHGRGHDRVRAGHERDRVQLASAMAASPTAAA